MLEEKGISQKETVLGILREIGINEKNIEEELEKERKKLIEEIKKLKLS